jgi:nicotinamide mononucleotide transporter
MESYWLQLLQNLKESTWLEYVAVISALAQVILAAKNKIENFYFGIISVAIYVYLYIIGKLYADASLNVYYFIISIYGLYAWRKTSEHAEISISASVRKDWIIAGSIAIISFCLSYGVLVNFTDSAVPLQDSAVAAFAWAGTWLLTKRKIESWWWLNISNAIAVPLYLQKGYVLTSLLTVLLFIIAIFGFYKWRKELVQ